jgi:hypothetical protein
MSKKSFRLTPKLLKQLVKEEKQKIAHEEAVAKADAWAGGENLVNKINFVKKLGLKEEKLVSLLRAIRTKKTAATKSIMKDIS